MSTSIEKNIQRIKRFSLTCTLNDNGHLRYFHNGHEYIEIGGIKWATMNVGATKVTDYGLYFQWGDTQGYTTSQVGSGEGKKYFGLADCKYITNNHLTKYNNADKKTVLESLDDAATFNMGVGWRMPTEAEFRLLRGSTTFKWVTNYKDSGVNGRLFIDKKDSSKELFFPAAGYCCNGGFGSVGCYGYYWSNSLYLSYVIDSCSLLLNKSSCFMSNNLRYLGFAVRGVVAE